MSNYTVLESGCWLWNGRPDNKGYGLIRVDGRTMKAHRFAYELLVGRIPDGMEIDHRCHTDDPSCVRGSTCTHRLHVNPFHCLEIVTPEENKRRSRSGVYNTIKTHCPKNHPYDDENTYIGSGGKRSCRACAAERTAARRALTAGALPGGVAVPASPLPGFDVEMLELGASI